MSSPYPPDNNDLVAVILGVGDSSFMCAHVIAKMGTIPRSTVIAPTLIILADEELLNAIILGIQMIIGVHDCWKQLFCQMECKKWTGSCMQEIS